MKNYLKIINDDITNGPGVRTTIWFSGCSHKCKNCFNSESWNPKLGQSFTDETKEYLFSLCDNNYTSGLTLTGGDPFFNIDLYYETLLDLVKSFKEKFPLKTIWCWTGFSYEELLSNQYAKEILQYIDVLIDGEFKQEIREQDLKQPNASYILRYRGSSNQRVIDIQKSLASNKVILYNYS